MSILQFIGIVINISMFVLVMAIGLDTTMKDATYLWRHPGLLVRSIIAMNLVMLLVVWAIIVVLNPATEVKLALTAIALSPIPPMLPLQQRRGGGTQDYTIGLLCAESVASIILVPLGLALLSLVFHADVHLSPGHEAGIIILSVLLPLAIGIVIRHAAPGFAKRMVRPVSFFALVVMVVALIPVLFVSWPAIWRLGGDGLFLGLIAFAAIGLAVGHWFGGPYAGDRTVLALATSTRHPGVAIAIASLNFPDLHAALAVVLFHLIVSNVVALPYLKWRKQDLTTAIGLKQ